MEEKFIKLMAYFGLLFVVVYAVATGLGKGDQVTRKPACKKPQKPDGVLWAGKSVPLGTTATTGLVVPSPPIIG